MLKLRGKLAILCAKAASTVIKKFGKGSGGTLPGYLALRIDPQLLSSMTEMFSGKVIVTMGTNGKTTTNSVICHALESQGKKVVINRTGANMLNGVTCAFVLAADRKGRLDADYACIEVDEFAALEVLPKLKPDCVLLTNIFRDQIDRYGEVDTICDRVREAISKVPEAKLVVNGDDFLAYTLISRCGNSITTYGISEQIFDSTAKLEVKESTFCRFCGGKLEYDFFHYGQIGSYHCPQCGFRRPKPDYTAENILFENDGYAFDVEGIHIDSQADAAYNVYNTLAAYAVLKIMDAPLDDFAKAVGAFDYGNNREEIYRINGAMVRLFLAKNPVGFQQKISLVMRDTERKDIIVQINDTAQDGRDVSWLWDVDFQYLRDGNAATITTAGNRRLDMALRLKYEDIPCDTTKDVQGTVERLSAEGTGRIYIIVNYSGLYSTNAMLNKMQEESIKQRENEAKQQEGESV